jgi:TldD protein
VKQITIITFALLLLCGASTTQAEDQVFEAMQAEMNRAMKSLVIEDMGLPHYLSYMIQDNDVAIIEARFGAIVQNERNQNRYLYTDLRVGSPEFDNSGFVSSWRDVYRQRRSIPVEDEYNALRHHLWLNTDQAYKRAQESLARKKAYLQTHPVKDELADMVPADCVVDLDQPVTLEDTEVWTDRVRTAAKTLQGYATLQDWRISYIGSSVNRRYLNSEGGRYTKGGIYQYLMISATAQATDGQRISHFTHFTVTGQDDPPHDRELVAAVNKMAKELDEMINAPVLDEFAGPVLLTDFAAAQFISQLLVSQVSPARKAIAAEEWMSEYLPAGKLPRRLNRRIMPKFITIKDDPDRKKWNDEFCAGYMKVDDEGVRSQDITLVKNGRLVDLPMGRTPTKKLTESNGHIRTMTNQWPMPCVTNLIVESSEPKSDLLKELRELCKEAEVEFGLMITRLSHPDVDNTYRWINDNSPETSLLTAPVVAYRVYADDGRIEPVRGLVFDEVTVRTLRDIAALGNDTKLTNMRQATSFQGITYPVSIITPSILVEEIEFKEGGSREPQPLTKNPMLSSK